MKALVVAAAALVASTQLAAAGTPGIDRRERNQAKRIYSGVVDGALTFRETERLVRGQAHVHRLERRAKSDGVVTLGERLRIHAAQNRQSQRIWRAKHN